MLLLWLFPCSHDSELEEAGKKEDEGLYPATWLGDRSGPSGGSMAGHDTGLRTIVLKVPFSKDTRQIDEQYSSYSSDNINRDDNG